MMAENGPRINEATAGRAFAPGFRVDRRDRFVLLAGGAAAVGLACAGQLLAAPVAGAVGHFFLFCNVFRVPRAPELVWAAVFLGASVALLQGTLGLAAWCVVCEAAAAAAVAWAMRQPSYHGVWWRRLNPGLPAWWERQG